MNEAASDFSAYKRLKDLEERVHAMPLIQAIERAHNEQMGAPITKDLLDARLEAIEARMDGRVAGMSSKLDTALAEMRADREANVIRFSSVAKDIGDIKDDLKEAAADSKAQFKTVIGNVWGASLATITIVGATLAIAISSFDSGRETSKNIAESTVRMEKLQMQLEVQTKALQALGPQAQPPR